jgi:hypothetical protein
LVGLVIVSIQCGDDTVEPPAGESITHEQMLEADSIAAAWFKVLYDTLLSMEDVSAEQFKNVNFGSMRSGFQQALDIEDVNELGNLGMALIELLEVNYSSTLWAFIDSLETWQEGLNWRVPVPPLPSSSENRHRTAIGNQFQLMVEMPMVTVARAVTAPDNVTLDGLQDIIENNIIPKLSNAINRMNAVEKHDTTEIRLCTPYDGFTECLRLDLGELMVFNAGFYALRSALYSAIAYDMDLFDADGTYEWVEAVAAGQFEGVPPWGYCCTYEVIEMGEIDDLNQDCYYLTSLQEAMADSILIAIVHHNLENRQEFLRLRNGGGPLRRAHSDMIAAFGKLEKAAAFIRDPDRDETEENVIKLADLTDFDTEMGNDPNKPNFMDGWTQLEDVIDFGRDLLSGPMTFTEEIAPSTNYTWRMDLSRMFLDPVEDWNDMLPYYKWNFPTGAWIVMNTPYYDVWDFGGWEHGFYGWDGEECTWVNLQNIGKVYYSDSRWDFNTSEILIPLDGPNGNPIDPRTEFLYFEDYTFNGLFPEMRTHQDWQDLYDILSP